MDLYPILISILRRFLGISLSWCVAVETPDPPLPPPDFPPQPNPPKAKRLTALTHALNQPPTHPQTMMIVSAEENSTSA